MALIKCPDCGKMFSEYAECCPECGCPVEDAKAEQVSATASPQDPTNAESDSVSPHAESEKAGDVNSNQKDSSNTIGNVESDKEERKDPVNEVIEEVNVVSTQSKPKTNGKYWLILVLAVLLVGGGIAVWLFMSKCHTTQEDVTKTEVPVVGMLTAYYATENFGWDTLYVKYKKGQLICDSNNPDSWIEEEDEGNYRYGMAEWEGGFCLLPKSKVEKKTFTMNQLTASDIGDKAVFVAEDGCIARFFWSNINGHGFFSWDGEEEKYQDEERCKECYVLSVEYVDSYDGEKHLFEEQLEEARGSIKLYSNIPYSERETPIGLIIDHWYPKEGWGYEKTSYSDDGKLLVDQWEADDGIPDEISIAYIAELNALYVNGQLYYRDNNKRQ